MPDPQKDYADAPLKPDELKSVGYTDAPLGAHPEAKIGPDPNAGVYPWRRAVVKGAVDSLPVLGGAVGATLGGGPEDVPAVALGIGAGRGLRDLVAEKIGLEPETSPAGKAARIALDTAIAGASPTVLQTLKRVVSNPKSTAADLLEIGTHPKQTLDKVIEFLREGQTTPTGMGTTRPPLRFPSPASAEPAAAGPMAVETPGPTLPAGTPPSPGMSPQQMANEFGTAMRRLGIRMTPEQETAAGELVKKGASPQQAVQVVTSVRANAAPAATATPAPASASAPAPAQNPPGTPGPAPPAKPAITAAETTQFLRLKARGLSDTEAWAKVQEMKDLLQKVGGKTAAEVRADMAHRAAAGQKSLVGEYLR